MGSPSAVNVLPFTPRRPGNATVRKERRHGTRPTAYPAYDERMRRLDGPGAPEGPRAVVAG